MSVLLGLLLCSIWSARRFIGRPLGLCALSGPRQTAVLRLADSSTYVILISSECRTARTRVQLLRRILIWNLFFVVLRTSKSPTRSDIAVSNAIHILIDAGSCNRSGSVGFFVFFFVDLRIRSYISRAYLNVKPFRTSNKQIKHVKRLWEYVAIIGVLTVKRYIFYGSVRKSNHGV